MNVLKFDNAEKLNSSQLLGAAERNFSAEILCRVADYCACSWHFRAENVAPRGKFRLVENDLNPGCRLASSNVTGNGYCFASYRRWNFNFFIRCRSVAVQLTICKFYQNLWVGSPFIFENWAFTNWLNFLTVNFFKLWILALIRHKQ